MKSKKSTLLFLSIFLTLGLSSLSFGQGKYLVLLKDKANNTFSVNNPESFLSTRAISRRSKQNIDITEQDLPLNKAYLTGLSSTGAKVIHKSKWLNAVLVEASPSQLTAVLNLPFVKGLEGSGDVRFAINGRKNIKDVDGLLEDIDPGTSKNQLEMLGLDKMHADGFKGKGVLIGIIDSGFSNADKLSVFQSVFAENRVLDTYDFVNSESNVYNDHSHGTNVFSCIGSSLQGQLLGTSPEASFALYTSEDVSSETRLEEANWLFAAERADSLGVDVINTSLGYSTFDNSAQNYTYQDLNGDKALITRAADWAASKGIIVVVSAGNEGSSAWKYISSPADGDSVISVGAVDESGNYVSFSSVGPTVDGRVKPEVASKGRSTTLASPNNTIVRGNGTSFSAPLIAGMMANFVQAFPNLSAMELRDILLKSGSIANSPDDFLGYGIPNYSRASDIANMQNLIKGTDKDVLIYPNPSSSEDGFKVLIIPEDAGNEFDVAVVDMTGKVIFQNNFKSKLFQVNVNSGNTAIGNYVLKISNDKFNFSERISVQ